MKEEARLVFKQSPKGWQFWREFVAPAAPSPGMALMAYTACKDNFFVRQWAVWPHPIAFDGVEPMPADVGKKIAPESIALNVATKMATGREIHGKPKRLIERWTNYHDSRPIVFEASSLWERLKRVLR